jgi:hypothetical protein
MPRTITDFASGHMPCGLPRRPAVSAIQSISPCHPAASAAFSFSGKSGRASAGAMPKLSKPSAMARARSSATRVWGLATVVSIIFQVIPAKAGTPV